MSADFHLVLGASGAQGSAIAKALLEQGQRVRGIVRSMSSKVPDGVEKIVADLSDAHAVQAAFADITHASITIPLVYDAATVDLYAQNIANAALAAGVKRLVFNFNIRTPEHASGIAAFDTRLSAEKILRATGIPFIGLQPAVYLENLLNPSAIDSIKNRGELYYPLPSEMAVSWISHSDLGKAVCMAHRLSEIPEKSIAIGNAALNGKAFATALSLGLGRSISYLALDPSIFERTVAGFIGADAAAGVAGIYHWAFANPTSALFAQNSDAQTSPQQWAAMCL